MKPVIFLHFFLQKQRKFSIFANILISYPIYHDTD